MIALARVNSLSPSSPWIRPNPESPTPPKGSAGTEANVSTELIDVIPLRIRRARSMAFFVDPEKIEPARPYLVALVRVSASSASRTRVMVRVGPNVSSRTATESSGTSSSTVGAT